MDVTFSRMLRRGITSARGVQESSLLPSDNPFALHYSYGETPHDSSTVPNPLQYHHATELHNDDPTGNSSHRNAGDPQGSSRLARNSVKDWWGKEMSPRSGSRKREKSNDLQHPYNRPHDRSHSTHGNEKGRYSTQHEDLCHIRPPEELDVARTFLQRTEEALHKENTAREKLLVDRLQQLEKELLTQIQCCERLRCDAQSQEENANRLERDNATLQRQLHTLRDQLATVGELCLRRGKALQEAGLSCPPLRVEHGTSDVPSAVAQAMESSGGTPAGRGRQKTERVASSEATRSGPTGSNASGGKEKKTPHSSFSLRSMVRKLTSNGSTTSTLPSAVGHHLPLSSASSLLSSATPCTAEPALSTLSRAPEVAYGSTTPPEPQNTVPVGQTTTHSHSFVITETNPIHDGSTTPNLNNMSTTMENRSVKSDGPSFDYNDLVPVKAEDLDPEFLAALHASVEAPSEGKPLPPVVSGSPQSGQAAVMSVVNGYPERHLNDELQMLRRQIDIQRDEMIRERERRDAAAHRQQVEHAQEREGWAKTVRRLEEINECCVRDLVACQRKYGPKLQAAEADVLSLKKGLAEALDAAEKVQQERHHLVSRAENVVADSFKQRFTTMKSQIAAKTEQWDKERQQLMRLVDEQQRQIKKLKSELESTTLKFQKEEVRYKLERNGAENELKLMRQSVRKMEKKVLFTKTREFASSADELSISKYYMA